MLAITTYLRAGLGLAVAVALIGSHAWVYHAGGEDVQLQWQRERAAAATAQAAVQAQAREREQAIAREIQQQGDQHAQETARRATAERSARTELDRLRTELGGLREQASAPGAGGASASATPAGGTDATATVLADVLGQCAGALQSLAAEADRLTAQVIGLQRYVRATQGAGD
jgi:hypothetical protein